MKLLWYQMDLVSGRLSSCAGFVSHSLCFKLVIGHAVLLIIYVIRVNAIKEQVIEVLIADFASVSRSLILHQLVDKSFIFMFGLNNLINAC